MTQRTKYYVLLPLMVLATYFIFLTFYGFFIKILDNVIKIFKINFDPYSLIYNFNCTEYTTLYIKTLFDYSFFIFFILLFCILLFLFFRRQDFNQKHTVYPVILTSVLFILLGTSWLFYIYISILEIKGSFSALHILLIINYGLTLLSSVLIFFLIWAIYYDSKFSMKKKIIILVISSLFGYYLMVQIASPLILCIGLDLQHYYIFDYILNKYSNCLYCNPENVDPCSEIFIKMKQSCVAMREVQHLPTLRGGHAGVRILTNLGVLGLKLYKKDACNDAAESFKKCRDAYYSANNKPN